MTTTRHAPLITADAPDTGHAPYFRRQFIARAGIVSAVLSVTGLGVVETYLNGHRIGDEMLAPGWTPYDHRLLVSDHDVTALLAPGANAVGAIVGEGWAVGRLGWEGGRNLYTKRPALSLRLRIEYDSGDVQIIDTSEQFAAGTGAVLEHSLYDGETYDATLEPVGWSLPGFDDSGWQGTLVLPWNEDAFQPPSGPPIRRIEELPTAEILTTPSGRTIVDFGQNISGWVRLTVTGERGRTLTLRHAELLTPEGELEIESNRSARATDRYTLRGEGPETWEPRFTFHGFRYVEVDGWPGALRPEDISAVVVHTDMRRTGWFETSDPLITQLHKNVVWSMRDNFVGVPSDCPQRDERLGWTGDINVFGPTAAFLFDVRGILGSWLEDLAIEQRARGLVPWAVPDVLRNAVSPAALWSDVAVSLPWALYQEYGELELLRRSYESMNAHARQVEGLLDDSGLWSTGFQYGDWLDPDAPANSPASGKTDSRLVAAAWVYRIMHEMQQTAKLLEIDDDLEHYSALAARVRAAFRNEYVTGSGRVLQESATAYALAITFDLLEPEQEIKAGQRLAKIVAERGFTISTGFAGTPLVTDALTRTGHLEEAYLLLTEKSCPSFLYPVTMGATTIWERWDSVLPDGTLNSTGMTSLNHYALGSVADWMHRTIGGLQRLTPGYGRVRIAPQPGGGLTSAKVAHDTVHGRIEVAWSIEAAGLVLEATVPEGIEAEVILPLQEVEETIVVGAGSHRWQRALPAGYGRTAMTLDTRLNQIAAEPQAWDAVCTVITKHIPAMPMTETLPTMGHLSLSALIELLPADPGALTDDLMVALALDV
ncbi:family 78 glycoside hydrolase catalytic domain [Pseudarthrobacter sp. NPDC058119]|uniref:alpha-L-rhamnosidase n=1 Tax=Pseudarthrobacter sp. NPDC058119 TaxID=3346348 RepID=UPI0036DB6830